MDIKWIYESAKRRNALTYEEHELVTSLSRSYAEWIKSLSPKEIHAIRKYTKNSLRENQRFSFFKRLNMMLESDNPKSLKDYKMLKSYSDTISEAIKRCSTPYDLVCYRGVNTRPVKSIMKGEEFVYKSFISTSLFRKHAFKCKYLMIIHIPKGIRAAYIDDISVYKGQFEVLIDKGYRYRLISIQGSTYEMEVLCDDD